MTLVVVLIACIFYYFAILPGKLRGRGWFRAYYKELTVRMSGFSLCQGPLGVLALVAPPILIFVVVYCLIHSWHVVADLYFPL